MKVIVGLGNPGKEYESTPHNVGFRIVDLLEKKLQKLSNIEHIGAEKHALYVIEEFWYTNNEQNREKLVLLKPQTYMNESGRAVKEYLRYHGNECDVLRDLWVVHDDGDIMLGRARLDSGKRAAGHRGVKSIAEAVGTKDFVRFRIGIRPPDEKAKTEEFVLKRPSKKEMEVYHEVEERIADGILTALEEGIEKAQNSINTKPGT